MRTIVLAVLLLLVAAHPQPSFADAPQNPWELLAPYFPNENAWKNRRVWKELPSTADDEIAFSRPLALGRAFIGIAEGNAAYIYNPAGIAQVQKYTIDGHFEFDPLWNQKVLSASVMDSISSPLAAELGYSFSWWDQEDRVKQNYDLQGMDLSDLAGNTYRHTARMTLGGKVSDYFMVGTTLKYAHVTRESRKTIDTATLDIGLLINTGVGLKLGIVGYNLLPIRPYDRWPIKLGVGLSFSLPEEFYIDYDQIVVFDVKEYRERPVISKKGGVVFTQPRGTSLAYRVGLEYIISQVVPLRVGYEHDDFSENHFFNFGIAYREKTFSINLSYSQGLVKSKTADRMLSFGFDFQI